MLKLIIRSLLILAVILLTGWNYLWWHVHQQAFPHPSRFDYSGSLAVAEWYQTKLEHHMADLVEREQIKRGEGPDRGSCAGILSDHWLVAWQLEKLLDWQQKHYGEYLIGMPVWIHLFDRPDVSIKSSLVTKSPWFQDKYTQDVFAYFDKIGWPWLLRHAHDIRFENVYAGDASGLPACWSQVYEEWQPIRTKEGFFATLPYYGVSHLLDGFYLEGRASILAESVELALRRAGCDIRGQDLADVGAGSGVMEANFRRMIGSEAKLYATDVEPFVLDVLRFMSQRQQVDKVIAATVKDCGLPENSVDVIMLIGIHMGAGINSPIYENETAPWMKSMWRALRPGGILLVHDSHEDLLKDGLSAKMQETGFKELVLCPVGYCRGDDAFCAIYRAVK